MLNIKKSTGYIFPTKAPEYVQLRIEKYLLASKSMVNVDDEPIDCVVNGKCFYTLQLGMAIYHPNTFKLLAKSSIDF